MPTIRSVDVRGFIGMMRQLFKGDAVYLRELTQNGLEAINQAQARHGVKGSLRIESRSDGEAAGVRVCDDGIGMTAEDLETRLTVLFRSGWPTGAGTTLGIGQFGFGFYSVFLVADSVEVISRARDQPDSAQRLSIHTDDGQMLIERIPTDGIPLGTTVSLTLRTEHRHLVEDELIRNELSSTFLYSPFRIDVNNRPLGLPTKESWTRMQSTPRGGGDDADWLQQRWGWSEPPLAVHVLRGQLRGWLVATPKGVTAPAVDLFRRGVAVTKAEVLPVPLSSCLCGLIDGDDVHLKPDRESLVDDNELRDLKSRLENECRVMLQELLHRNPMGFSRLLNAHRQVLTIAMLGDSELRQSIGTGYALPMFGPKQDDEDFLRIGDIDSESRELIWVADAEKERVFADRAYHLGQRPVVIQEKVEQELVRMVCSQLDIQCVPAKRAYLNEMRECVKSSPRCVTIFREIVPDDCEIFCADDRDERFPAKVLMLEEERLSLPEPDDLKEVLLQMMIQQFLRDKAGQVIVLNARHPLIQRFEQRSGPAGLSENRLAQLVYFLGRLVCGIRIPIEESTRIYELIADQFE
jgi:hypothetical protein